MKISEEQVKAFNELRLKIGLVPYPKTKMQEMISKIIPCNDNYWSILTSMGIIEHIREGKKHYYMFTSSPIHLEKFNTYAKKCSEIIKKYGQKKTNNIEEAIKLLKENGYRIYKKIEKYEEI